MGNVMNLIFDVDGTLTESRQKIDPFFLYELEGLAKNHSIFLATGSDYAKTEEQLGSDFLENHVFYSFNCSGNSIWRQGKEAHRSKWNPPQEILDWLQAAVDASEFSDKAGNHIELRPGMVNVSIVGRAASPEQRLKYQAYDLSNKERLQLVDQFNDLFLVKYSISAQVAGVTGFDIFPEGCDKAQILEYFEGIPIVFFGDDTQPGGNDYSLAKAIRDRALPGDGVYDISSPSEVRMILSSL